MGQHNVDQIHEESTMNDSKGGKSKSNKESILRNWKLLKQNIEPITFVREYNFPQQSSFNNLGSRSRSRQATLVLIEVYRQVQSSEKEYNKFVKLLNSTAADALSKAGDGPINQPQTVDEHTIKLASDRLKQYGKTIKDKLKRKMDVVLEITDNFIECGLLDIDGLEEILHSQKEPAEVLVEFVIRNLHLGTYNLLLKTLESDKHFRSLVSDLNTAGVSDDKKTAKPTVQLASSVSPDVTTKTASAITLAINGTPENTDVDSELLDPYSSVELSLFKNLGLTTEKKTGSAKFIFGHEFLKQFSDFKDRIQNGIMVAVMEDTIKHMDSSALKGVSQLDVKLFCSSDKVTNISRTKLQSDESLLSMSALEKNAISQVEQQTTESVQRTPESEQHTTESVQHTMNVAIIAVNRSFLIEEINTMTLVRAFQDKGVTCFDGLDGTLGRQQRAEYFLTILERNNLIDQLLVILREQGMTYVLDRLNNCRNAFSADPQILRRNITSNRANILENLDIDDVREIFIEREVFSSRMFDEIEKKYSGSEDQMSFVLIEIIKSGPRAMRTLVDAMYINQLASLADIILRETPNELQEMQENSQTVDSSSEGELLYKARYVVSKADEKPPVHHMSEHSTLSLPAK